METKKDIRDRILKERSLLPEALRVEKSRCILEYLFAHRLYGQAKEIYSYVDFRGEVITKELFLKAWEDGKRTAAPKVIGDKMAFFYIAGFSDLEPGYCKILEPKQHCRMAESPDALIIMPGAAFDTDLNRIGYGGGFYDRYLAEHPDIHRIELAFELQHTSYIPAGEHDRKPEAVITERQIYERKGELQ